MTYPLPDPPQPMEGTAPDTDLNASPDQLLPPNAPPISNPRPGYWAVPPQPQAPTWPYAGAPVYPPMPPMPDTATSEAIGPDHVPWKWYDVVGAAWLFVLTLGLNLAAHFLPSNGTVGTTDVPLSTRLLVINTIVSVVIYGLILLSVWGFTIRKYHLPRSALGVRRIPGIYYALFPFILLAMYLLAAVVSGIVVYVFYGGHATNPQEKEITGGGSFSWLKLVLALITASIAAPIVEELFFRGVLYGWLRTRWHAVAGVILSAAIFSSAHAIPLILASIFVVGVTLAIVYEKTKSTLATMMLHSAFNTIGVIYVFYQLAHK